MSDELSERIAARVREECARIVEAEAMRTLDVWGREALYRAAETLRAGPPQRGPADKPAPTGRIFKLGGRRA